MSCPDLFEIRQLCRCGCILQDRGSVRSVSRTVIRRNSLAFDNGDALPACCGKKADNISLPPAWANVLAGTQSFALVLADTRPVARGNVHWMISNVPAESRAFRKAEATDLPPENREHKAYLGPFPTSGTHSYEFRPVALDTPNLGHPSKVAFGTFARVVDSMVLDEGVLVGTFTKVRPAVD